MTVKLLLSVSLCLSPSTSMASCVVLCRGFGACACVSAPRRKNGLFCVQTFYIILFLDCWPGETCSSVYCRGPEERRTPWSKKFLKLWYPVVRVNEFSSSVLCCCCCGQSEPPASSAERWNKTFWLLNHLWSDCSSTKSLLLPVAYTMSTLLQYKEARANSQHFVICVSPFPRGNWQLTCLFFSNLLCPLLLIT